MNMNKQGSQGKYRWRWAALDEGNVDEGGIMHMGREDSEWDIDKDHH